MMKISFSHPFDACFPLIPSCTSIFLLMRRPGDHGLIGSTPVLTQTYDNVGFSLARVT
jgi:hypothetical protein